MDQDKKILCIACSIFKHELEEIKNDFGSNLEISYLSSMLHMDPELLDSKLNKALRHLPKDEENIIIVYGDCSPYMSNFNNKINLSRTNGINCIEIFLGKEKFQQLRKEGAFFLMPEWTLRWKEVFKFELQLEGDIATEFMQDFHSKIIYLDTGVIKIPNEHLKEIEEYTGLPVEIHKANNIELKKSVEEAINNLEIIKSQG